jgi:hypothetical protein
VPGSRISAFCLGKWGKGSMSVLGYASMGRKGELGLHWSSLSCGAARQGPEAALRPVSRNAIPQSRPTTPGRRDHSGAQGPREGRGFWPFLWEESPSKRVQARTQDFHFNAPWQAALPRNLLKAHGKAFKNTLITNNSSASPDFPPRGAGAGPAGAEGSFTCACAQPALN